MRNPDNKDSLTAYSAADRAIMQASMNASRLANKKAPAKKAAAKPMAKKAAAPKPTDSRFSGIKKPSVTKPTDSRFTGVKKAAPKPMDSRFSGTKPAMAKKAAPAQKTRPTFGGFSMLASGFKKQDTSSPAYKANQAKLTAAWDKAKAAKKSK